MTSHQKYTVLLVEDEPADVHLVRMAFREVQSPVEMHHVQDGAAALDYLQSKVASGAAPRPDLILLDLNMPRMDGREFLAAFKKDETISDIPVVVLTTSEVERDVVSTYKLGAAGYVVKPAEMEDFFATIRRLEEYWFTTVRIPKTAY